LWGIRREGDYTVGIKKEEANSAKKNGGKIVGGQKTFALL
jgi:hypothetical protein